MIAKSFQVAYNGAVAVIVTVDNDFGHVVVDADSDNQNTIPTSAHDNDAGHVVVSIII